MNLTTPVSSRSNECQRLGVPPEPVHTVTVAQYHAMIRAGTLADDRPMELLEGCFASCTILRTGESAPLILDGQNVGEIQVDDLLP